SLFFSYPKPLPVLQGPLAVNTLLKKAQRIFEGEIIGPESFAADRNGTFDSEPICGRPKGMKMNPLDPNNSLVFIDSYSGLQEVNVHTGEIKTHISKNEGVNNVPFYFLNALDITRDGKIYFTDSSLKWDRRNYRYEVIEVNKQGRLMTYDLTTGESKLLLDKLFLANGIALSQDESMLVVAEMSACRIRRYYLKGDKAGQTDILIENLPGYPDNIKLNSKGHFYVGMGSVRYYGVSKIGPFLDLVGPYPAVKRFLTKITPLKLFDIFMPKHSIILEIDIHGNIVSSLHDLGAKVIQASGEGFEHNGTLYVGSFWAPYVGQLDLSDIRS
ncbi:hypothetical protein FSP39_019724, partial [Pinctada imbricata]